MAFIIQDTEEISKLTQKIVKTDEVLNLVRIKHKELSRVEKRYHKLLEQNFQLKTEYKVVNDRLKDCIEKHTPLEYEINDLKNSRNTLQDTYHEYVNKHQLKYQEACQKIEDLKKEGMKKSDENLNDNIEDLSLQLELTRCEMQNNQSSFKSEKMTLIKDFNNKIQKLKSSVEDLQLQLELTHSELEINADNYVSEKQALTDDFKKKIKLLDSKILDLQLQLKSTHSVLDINKRNHALEKIKLTAEFNEKINTLNQVLQMTKTVQDSVESSDKRETMKTCSTAVQTDFVSSITELPKYVDKYCTTATQTVREVEKTEIEPIIFSTVAINGDPKMSSTLSTQTDFESTVLKRPNISDKHFSVSTEMIVDIKSEHIVNITSSVEERLNPSISSELSLAAFEEKCNVFISSDVPITTAETETSKIKTYSTLSTQTDVQISPNKLHSIIAETATELDLPSESMENNLNEMQKLLNMDITSPTLINTIEGELASSAFSGISLHSIEEELIPANSSQNFINPIEDHHISPTLLSNYCVQGELNTTIFPLIHLSEEELYSPILSEMPVNTIKKTSILPIATVPVNVTKDLPNRTISLEAELENNLPSLSVPDILEEDFDVSDILEEMRKVPYLISPLSHSQDSNSLSEVESLIPQFVSPLKILDNIEINDKVVKDNKPLFNFSTSFKQSNPLYGIRKILNTSMLFKPKWRSRSDCKITKKYKGTKNKLLETIKIAKIDIKQFLQCYMTGQEKPIIVVSSKIIKSTLAANCRDRARFSNICCNNIPLDHQSLCSCYISNFHKPCCSCNNIPRSFSFSCNNCVHMANECHKCSVKKCAKRPFSARDDSDIEDELMQKIMKRCRKIVKQTIQKKDDGLLNTSTILKEESNSSGDYELDRNKRRSTILPDLQTQNKKPYAKEEIVRNVNFKVKISETNVGNDNSTAKYESSSNKLITSNLQNTEDSVRNNMRMKTRSHGTLAEKTSEVADNTMDNINISEICDNKNLRDNALSHKPKQGFTKLQKLQKIQRNLRSNNKPVIKSNKTNIENNLRKDVKMSPNKRMNIVRNISTKQRPTTEISSPSKDNFNEQENNLFGSESESELEIKVQALTPKKTRVSKLTSNPQSVQPNIVNKNTSLTSVVIDKEKESVIKRVLRKDVKKTLETPVDNLNNSSVIESCELSSGRENNVVFKKPQGSKLSISLRPKSAELEKIENRNIQLKIIPLEPQENKGAIFLAKKMISDLAILNIESTELLRNTIRHLSTFEAELVAKLIIEQAATDFSQVYEKKYSPPAPLLTKAQQQLILLLEKLEETGVKNLRSTFLKLIKLRILQEKLIEVVHPLTRMYVSVSKLVYQILDVRNFCCDAAYYMGDLFVPIMFITLTIWGDVLPMASADDDNPVAMALIQVIQNKFCRVPGYNFSNLIKMLADYYGYANGRKSNDEVMEYLVTVFKDKPSPISYISIKILCKNVTGKWTATQIQKYLIPIVEKGNISTENECLTRKTLHLITKLHEHLITIAKNTEETKVISVWLEKYKNIIEHCN